MTKSRMLISNLTSVLSSGQFLMVMIMMTLIQGHSQKRLLLTWKLISWLNRGCWSRIWPLFCHQDNSWCSWSWWPWIRVTLIKAPRNFKTVSDRARASMGLGARRNAKGKEMMRLCCWENSEANHNSRVRKPEIASHFFYASPLIISSTPRHLLFTRFLSDRKLRLC